MNTYGKKPVSNDWLFYFYGMRILSFIFLCLAIAFNTYSQSPVAKRIILIGVDGMSPNGIQNAPTPYMDDLVKKGSSSFTAQAVLPSSSSPNWASMIMGAGPDLHGVTSNAWQPNKQTIALKCTGKQGNGKDSEMWPTFYGVLREQKTDAKIYCFHDWLGYGRLVEKGVCTKKKGTGLIPLIFGKGNDQAIRRGMRQVRKKNFDFLFIHLDHVDHAGHKYGHGTQEYFDAVAYADVLIGQVVEAVKAAGLEEETIIMVTADHGGINKGHGGNTPEEVTIPWIVYGAGIKANYTVTANINTYDTAVTLCMLYGLKPPECWIGKSIFEIIATGN